MTAVLRLLRAPPVTILPAVLMAGPGLLLLLLTHCLAGDPGPGHNLAELESRVAALELELEALEPRLARR